MDYNKLPNSRKAEIRKREYQVWKKTSLDRYGYFPVFQPFRETFLLRDLSGNALRLYLYLGMRTKNETGETWVSIDTMASYFNKSKRTISGWLKELEEKELIDRFQLKPNEVAHTFLLPYGWGLEKDENSLQNKSVQDTSDGDSFL